MNQTISDPTFPKMQNDQEHKHHDHNRKDHFFMIIKTTSWKLNGICKGAETNTK